LKIHEKKELIEFLQKLIQINSENPPGNESQIANFIHAYLLKNNIEAKIIPLEKGRDSLIAKIPGKEERNIALCGHLDTVRVKKEYWRKPPFEGLIENNRMYGRGTSDMKGGVAAMIFAAILLKREKIIPHQTIMLALTADEEWKYRGAKDLTDKGFFDQTDFLIIAEPSTLKVSSGEKGEVWIKAAFHGKSAHGSTPEEGINSIIPGSELVKEVAEKYDEIFKSDEFWGKTSINVGQFHGGVQVNVVPNYSEIQFDFRVISAADRKKAIDLIKTIGENIARKYRVQFESEIFNDKQIIFTNPKNPYIQKFMRVAGVNEVIITRYCTDGATIIPEKKMPFIIYGPGDIAQAHQNDEYIELDSLYLATDTFLRFLQA